MIVKMVLADAAIGDEQALRAEPNPIRSGMPASAAASAGRIVRSSIQSERKRCRRNSATSRIRLTPRCNSDPKCAK